MALRGAGWRMKPSLAICYVLQPVMMEIDGDGVLLTAAFFGELMKSK
jgi:hypothetical protein